MPMQASAGCSEACSRVIERCHTAVNLERGVERPAGSSNKPTRSSANARTSSAPCSCSTGIQTFCASRMRRSALTSGLPCLHGEAREVERQDSPAVQVLGIQCLMTDEPSCNAEQVAIDLLRPAIATGRAAGVSSSETAAWLSFGFPRSLETVIGRPVGHFPVLQPPHFRAHLAIWQQLQPAITPAASGP